MKIITIPKRIDNISYGQYYQLMTKHQLEKHIHIRDKIIKLFEMIGNSNMSIKDSFMNNNSF